MNKLADLLAFIDLVLSPGFDVVAAEKRLGPIDRWDGETAYVKDSDFLLADSAIETLDGTLTGVQTNPRPPLVVPWSDIEAALGKRGEPIYDVDDLTGPAAHHFVRQSPSGGRGEVSLYAQPDEDPARIERIIVRPTAIP